MAQQSDTFAPGHRVRVIEHTDAGLVGRVGTITRECGIAPGIYKVELDCGLTIWCRATDIQHTTASAA